MDANWLVKNLLPTIGLCFLAGPSMAGKSFIAIELAAAIAKGEFVFNRRSRRSGVIYLAAEGANGMRHRIEGLRRERGGRWDRHVHLADVQLNLTDETVKGAFLKRLCSAKRRLADRGVGLGLLVIDTLSATIPGANENSSEDMGPILAFLQKLAAELGACILVVAHLGKDAERGIRGWSGQFANADGVILVNAPDGDGVRQVTIAKVKDGESGQKLAFSLRQIHLRDDADGDPVTTCTVEWRDLPEPSVKSTAKRAMKPWMKAILTTLESLEPGCSARPTGLPRVDAEGSVVKVKDLQAAVFRTTFVELEPDEEAQKARWRDNRRKAFVNNLGYLARDGHVMLHDEYVWRIPPTEAAVP